MLQTLSQLMETLTGTDALWIQGSAALAGSVLFVFVYAKLGDSMSFPLGGGGRAVGVLLATALLLAAVSVAARLHLEPRFGPRSWPMVALLAIPVCGVFPKLFNRARYGRGLLALLLSRAAAIALAALVLALVKTFLSGNRSLDGLRNRPTF